MNTIARVAMLLAILLWVASLASPQTASASAGGAVLSLSYDGTLSNSGDNYTTVQNNGVETDNVVVEYTTTSLLVGQSLVGSTYNIYRGVLFFDTTAVPLGVSIASAYVTLHGRANHSTTDFDVVLVSPGDMHSPLEVVDFATMCSHVTALNQTFQSGYYGVTMRLDLNARGINSVIHDGVTVFGIRSSRDIEATPPSGDEYLEFYSSESAYPPELTLVYYGAGQLGTPNMLTISSCAVFSDYRETGDQLWVCRAYVKYLSGAEDLNAKDYWLLQILDGDVVKASVPLWEWGYVPASIYLSAANALPWDNYTMQLIGNPAKYGEPIPYVQHAMVASEYKGADYEGLDSWCMATALDIGRVEKGDINYYRTPVSYYDASKAAYPWKINDAGQILFTGGIPLIDTVRANLFANPNLEPSTPTHTGHSYADGLWDNWGTSFSQDWALIGQISGVSGRVTASVAWMALVFAVVYVVSRETGKPILGMIPGVLGILLGTLLGAPNIVVILSILALAVMYLAYELIPTRT